MKTYITAGELAHLASTTKRTIHFYDQKGVLKPAKVNSARYRLYEERQVLDYQMILLLSTLGVSLGEIKQYLRKNGNLTDLFHDKKHLIKRQILQLEHNLTNLEKFLRNLQVNGTMVNPKIIELKPLNVLYIEKVGSYARIGEYCEELLRMITSKHTKPTTLAIFEDQGYRPKSCRMKIGVLASADITILQEYEQRVRSMTLAPGKVITYTHNGSGSLLSLFWKELEKYCVLHSLVVNRRIPDFEIYRTVDSDPARQFFEIYLPITE